MKVLLVKDVYKLGRAGDVKRVADGYGRNYLLPQGLAVLATAGAMKQIETIRTQANARRSALNQEMGSQADRIAGQTVAFPGRAGETGKLYGSITTQMIADAISQKTGVKVERRQVDSQPIRTLGEHKARIRLTVDLLPEFTIVVHREGEIPNLPGLQPAAAEAPASAGAPVAAEETVAAEEPAPSESEEKAE